MQLLDLPDIVGDGAVHPLNAAVLYARFVKLTAVGGACRIGGSTVSASRGVSIPSGTSMDIELDGGDITEQFCLNQISAFIPNGTTLTISYGAA